VKVSFTANGWGDYLFWISNDLHLLTRINELIADARRHPFIGIGKPEPLKGRYGGWWSRRINREHRLAYRVQGTGDDQAIEIAQCRYHY
jgi:toxin YoeB